MKEVRHLIKMTISRRRLLGFFRSLDTGHTAEFHMLSSMQCSKMAIRKRYDFYERNLRPCCSGDHVWQNHFVSIRDTRTYERRVVEKLARTRVESYVTRRATSMRVE